MFQKAAAVVEVLAPHFDGAARLRALHWMALAAIVIVAAALRVWSASATQVREPQDVSRL